MEREKVEFEARLALADLQKKTLLLSAAGPTRLLKIVGGLAALAWMPIVFFTQRAFPDHQSALWYVVVPLVVSIILSSAYTRLTNNRIDALLKLIGEERLLRNQGSDSKS